MMGSGRARAALVQDTRQVTARVSDWEWCCPRFDVRAATVPLLVHLTSYYIYYVRVQANYSKFECTSRFWYACEGRAGSLKKNSWLTLVSRSPVKFKNLTDWVSVTKTKVLYSDVQM